MQLWQTKQKKRLWLVISFSLAIAVSGFGIHLFGKTADKEGTSIPLGERKYLLPQKARNSAVTIEALKSSKSISPYLRDPATPGTSEKTAQAPTHAKNGTHKADQKTAEKPKYAIKHLRFAKIAVNGKLVEPRVHFARESLSIDRRDEPVSQDFFQKVFEPAREYRAH